MELTFWERCIRTYSCSCCRLNPCFCGTYLLRIQLWSWLWLWWYVLILVFVELTFWVLKHFVKQRALECLNPCFCGTYLLSCYILYQIIKVLCLNPCFCGTYLLRANKQIHSNTNAAVLILVFVELTFWVLLKMK